MADDVMFALIVALIVYAVLSLSAEIQRRKRILRSSMNGRETDTKLTKGAG